MRLLNREVQEGLNEKILVPPLRLSDDLNAVHLMYPICSINVETVAIDLVEKHHFNFLYALTVAKKTSWLCKVIQHKKSLMNPIWIPN